MKSTNVAIGLALVAIVIAGCALFRVPVANTMLGSATNCTDGYSCVTNLEVQGNLINDGIVNFDKATLCINFYSTSTATRLKLVASTTPTLPNGAAAVMVAQYGTCSS